MKDRPILFIVAEAIDSDGKKYPTTEIWPLWTGGEHGERFAMVMDNPRFILPDGSKIWGAECWWREESAGPVDLPAEQAGLEKQKIALALIAEAARSAAE